MGPDRERPVLVYDGDCAFCRRCVDALERIGVDARAVAWQQADLDELGVGERQAADAVQWVEPDGTVHSGHAAIAAALRTAGPAWRLAGRTIVLPGVARLSARAYRLVADNRDRAPRWLK